MLISFVLRLAPAALADGRLAGEVEHVQTGERAQFRDAAELARWCAAAGAARPSVVVLDLPEPRPDSALPPRTLSLPES